MKQEVTAYLHYLRTSPRRMRLLVDLVRGKRVTRALDNLTVLNKKHAKTLSKLLLSAVANAEHNHSFKAEDLVIKTIMVDGGPVIKRFMPKAHGRATPVRERTSHISVVLANVPKKEKSSSKTKK